MKFWENFPYCASTPQASIWVRAGKGLGSSAFLSSQSTRLVTVRGLMAKVWGMAVFSRFSTSVLPSLNRTVAWVHQLSWGKSARRVSRSSSSVTGRPKSSVRAALGSRLMPQLW